MEISFREFMTCLHGMLFGGFFLMAAFGVIVLLLEWRSDRPHSIARERGQNAYLMVTAALGWAAVLSGAYVVYPWYRAVAPPGANLAYYPQRLLMSSPTTAGWHSLGMEWKEHVAWFAPMVITMVTFVLTRHRAIWDAERTARRAVLSFAAAALVCGLLAGGWGAMIDKAAPVRGTDAFVSLPEAK